MPAKEGHYASLSKRLIKPNTITIQKYMEGDKMDAD